MSVCDVLFQGPYGRRCPIDHQCCPARVWGRPCKAHVLVNRVFLITDKDKVHHRRPNICCIFEKQRVLGYQIWLFCTIPPGGILMGLISKLLGWIPTGIIPNPDQPRSWFCWLILISVPKGNLTNMKQQLHPNKIPPSFIERPGGSIPTPLKSWMVIPPKFQQIKYW